MSRRLEQGPFAWVEIEERELVPVPRHTHACAHLCLPFRGPYAAEAASWGDGPALGVLFHPAGTTHADRFRAAGGGCLTVSFAASWLEELFAGELPARSTARHDPLCTASALRLLGAGRAGVEAAALEEAALLALAPFAARIDARERAPRPWIREAQRILRERCDGPLRIRDLACEVGVHPVVLARGFRRRVGCTPLQFLRRARIHRALQRLRWSRSSLAEIALATGFADQAQFTRAFRQETGWTPSALRALVRHS